MAKLPEALHKKQAEPEDLRTQTEINFEWIQRNLRRCKKFKNGANNHEYIMCSPLRSDDKNPSFSVNAEKGVYHDFGTGENGTLTELAKRLNVDAPAYAKKGRGFSAATVTASQPERAAAASQPQKKKAAQSEGLQALTELQTIWNAGSEDIKKHPYIKKKGINSSFVDWRTCTTGRHSGWLMIPAYSVTNGTLQAIQFISEGGRKDNSEGAEFKNAVWPAGKTPTTGKESEVIICEGAATAATVKELRPAAAVFCTFSVSNMPATAQHIKAAFVASDFIVAADSGKAGENAYKEITQGKQATASEAGRLPIEALKALPRKKKVVPADADYSDNTDWNDIATKFGKDFAAAELEKCIKWEKLFRDILAQTEAEQKLKIETAAEMFATDDAPMQWTIENLIPEGLSVLAGDPKKGKSFLALQMSLAVAGGTDFMGLSTKKGTVLHMALEDGRRRTKERIKYFKGREAAEAGALFAFSSPRFNENGLRELLYIIRDAEPVFIVVDVWNAVKPPTQKGINKNAYEADHEAASILNKLGTETHTAILAVHHRKKGADSADLMTEGLSGSMGLPAAASAILSLFRQDNSQHAILYKIGRDYTEDTPMQLHFSRGQEKDGEPFGWRLATKEEIDSNSEPQNENDRMILDALEAESDGLTQRQLAKITNIKKATVSKRLNILKSLGQVKKIKKGNDDIYFLIEPEDSDSQPEARLHIDEIIKNAEVKQQAVAEAEAAARQPAGQQVLADIGEALDID